MPFYHKLGKIPPKRHTVSRQENGQLYQEHLVSSYGFSGPSSLLYRLEPPTKVLSTKLIKKLKWEEDPDATLRMRHFRLPQMKTGGSFSLDRIPLMFNGDVAISWVQPDKSDDFFFRNGQADELIYVSEGQGILESEYGDIPFKDGDHLIIPRSIIYRLNISKASKLLVVEATGFIKPPDRYRNNVGQFMEHSPYCERDIRPPQSLQTINEKGEFRVLTKRDNAIHEIFQDHHPFDVSGWDGNYYPWAFSIFDFEPITGSLHQPPPVHQTFAAEGFVTCAFVPRMFDYHPDSIPAPYNHSNVMSDEILYYANNEFMSRKGIEYGSLTLHPSGIPHGPHPGKMEGSIGKDRTEELAFMLDTFRPLKIAKAALDVEDSEYGKSWL